jgi:hypothetical protein
MLNTEIHGFKVLARAPSTEMTLDSCIRNLMQSCLGVDKFTAEYDAHGVQVDSKQNVSGLRIVTDVRLLLSEVYVYVSVDFDTAEGNDDLLTIRHEAEVTKTLADIDFRHKNAAVDLLYFDKMKTVFNAAKKDIEAFNHAAEKFSNFYKKATNA